MKFIGFLLKVFFLGPEITWEISANFPAKDFPIHKIVGSTTEDLGIFPTGEELIVFPTGESKTEVYSLKCANMACKWTKMAMNWIGRFDCDTKLALLGHSGNIV